MAEKIIKKEIKENQNLPALTDKNSVVKFEFNNLSHIILFKTKPKDGKRTIFWHATMNSALFMKYLIPTSTS